MIESIPVDRSSQAAVLLRRKQFPSSQTYFNGFTPVGDLQSGTHELRLLSAAEKLSTNDKSDETSPDST